MNLSVLDTGTSDARRQPVHLARAIAEKGGVPLLSPLLCPEQAEPLYERFVAQVEKLGVRAAAGTLRRDDGSGSLVNDGPVTLLLDSKGAF